MLSSITKANTVSTFHVICTSMFHMCITFHMLAFCTMFEIKYTWNKKKNETCFGLYVFQNQLFVQETILLTKYE